MTDILATFAQQRSSFVPSKPSEYLALQVARRLQDESAFRYYLSLFERHPEDLLLRAFRKCCARGQLTGAEFVKTVKQLTHQES